MTDAEVQIAIELAVAEALELATIAATPPIQHVLKFFKFAHLPPHLRATSCMFADVAARTSLLSSNAETTVALRKLLEAKDAAVRSVLG